MSAHSILAVQKIPVNAEEAWDFFSNPANLPLITPGNLKFRITSQHHGEKMYTGQIIEYKVAPIANIPLYWMTEITHVEFPRFFIDEQRFGPYAMWHHQHHFKKVEGGVEMTDIVHYKNPLGIVGEMMNPLLVRPKLEQIFLYRFQQVEKIFGKWPDGQNAMVKIY